MPFKFSYYILTILHKYGGGKKVTHNLICFKKKRKKDETTSTIPVKIIFYASPSLILRITVPIWKYMSQSWLLCGQHC